MANLPESSNFDAGVYQLETTDFVAGGLAGTSNKQALSLANRTVFLRNLVNDAGIPTLKDATANISTLAKTGFYYAPAAQGVPNLPGSGINGPAYVQHLHYDANTAIQTLYYVGSDVVIFRRKTAGAWGGWRELTNDAYVTGMVAVFPFNSVPPGWLALNGSLVSRATYARLWNGALAYGAPVSEATWGAGRYGAFSTGDGSSNFRLPDLRGEFVRGWDDGRGVDATRIFGSYQPDEFKSHTHDNGSYNQLLKQDGQGTGTDFDPGVNQPNLTGSQNMSAAGGFETRPRNIAMAFYIKY